MRKQRKKNRLMFILFLVNGLFIAANGQDIQKRILGNWYSIKADFINEEMLDERLLYEDKWRIDTTFFYFLNGNNMIFISLTDTTYNNYSLNGNKLKIGLKEYKIEKIKKDRMKILDISKKDCCMRYFLKREENGE